MKNLQDSILLIVLMFFVGLLGTAYADWYQARQAYFEKIEKCQDRVREEQRTSGFGERMNSRELWNFCDSQIVKS